MNHSKYLSAAELKALMADLASSRAQNERDAILIEILVHTGGRASEVLNLTKADLSLESRVIYLRGLKGSENRELPLPCDVYQRLASYVQTLPADQTKVFTIGYQRLKQIWDKFRPNNKKLHSLRHTKAINAYKKTKNILLVKDILGHKDLTSTMIYQTYAYSAEEKRAAL